MNARFHHATYMQETGNEKETRMETNYQTAPIREEKQETAWKRKTAKPMETKGQKPFLVSKA